MQKDQNRQADAEIEVTPEMIEAGVFRLVELLPFAEPVYLVSEVYEAMAQVQNCILDKSD